MAVARRRRYCARHRCRCNPMRLRLQPSASQAALRTAGCNPTYPRLQPYVSQRRPLDRRHRPRAPSCAGRLQSPWRAAYRRRRAPPPRGLLSPAPRSALRPGAHRLSRRSLRPSPPTTWAGSRRRSPRCHTSTPASRRCPSRSPRCSSRCGCWAVVRTSSLARRAAPAPARGSRAPRGGAVAGRGCCVERAGLGLGRSRTFVLR